MNHSFKELKSFHLFNRRFIDKKLYNSIDKSLLPTAINIKRIIKNRARLHYKSGNNHEAERFLNEGTNILLNLSRIGAKL